MTISVCNTRPPSSPPEEKPSSARAAGSAGGTLITSGGENTVDTTQFTTKSLQGHSSVFLGRWKKMLESSGRTLVTHRPHL